MAKFGLIRINNNSTVWKLIFFQIVSLLTTLIIGGCKLGELDSPDWNGRTALWSFPFSPALTIESLEPVVYDEMMIGSQMEGLVGINVDAGETVWQNSKLPNSLFLEQYCHSDYMLILGGGIDSRVRAYGIDMRNGSILWSDDRGSALYLGPFALSNSYYYYRSDSSKLEFSIGDLYSSNFNSFELVAGKGSIYNCAIFEGKNSPNYLFYLTKVISYVENQQIVITYASLYDLSNSTYKYQDRQLGENIYFEKIIDDRVFFQVGLEIWAFDLLSGNLLWSTVRPSGQFNMIVSSDRLILVNSSTLWKRNIEKQAFGYNLTTGKQLWTLKIGGRATTLSELNGVVYWTDTEDKNFYAVDAESGDLLWRFECPKESNLDYWKTPATIMAGKSNQKGKILVSSQSRMYVYEAAK